MQFTVSTSELHKELQVISGVIGNNSVIPILQDFLFDLKNGVLNIAATDLETAISSKITVESEEDGSVAIPAKILLDILKNLPEQPLTFQIEPENYSVEIVSQSGSYKLAGEDPSDFPPIPTVQDQKSFPLPAPIFQKMLNKILFAVSNDELRPSMTGVYVDLSESAITFVATDAQKLVRYVYQKFEWDAPGSFIIPKKALSLLKNAISGGEEDETTISYDSKNVFFTYKDVVLSSRLIEGRYPDYNAVIPVNNPNQMTVDRNDFQNALKRISIFANKTTYQVILSLNDNTLNIAAQDIDFANEAQEDMPCQYEGTPMQIAFNARFLIEILNALGDDTVTLELSEPGRAGILVPTEKIENEELIMLVMPIMMNT